jgi:hypothetical protein
MALSPPSGFTSSDLVFQDDFSGTTLDTTWHNYITSNAAQGSPWNSNGSGGSGPGGAYDAYYDMPSQVSVNNGTLDLTAIKQTVSGVNQGSAQTFPITSGAVSSYGNFEFTRRVPSDQHEGAERRRRMAGSLAVAGERRWQQRR